MKDLSRNPFSVSQPIKAGVTRVPQRSYSNQPARGQSDTQGKVPDEYRKAVPPAEKGAVTAARTQQKNASAVSPERQRSRATGSRADRSVEIDLEFTKGSLLTGMIMSEVLGKPKCLRKRW